MTAAFDHHPAPGRLALTPRLHRDETLSSWLNRLAFAYGLTVRELFQWLGYARHNTRTAAVTFDVDTGMPELLAEILSVHSGLDVQLLLSQQILAADALSMARRRTFCAECWREEGPYRRREWASTWSLVCVRHRCVLSQKPQPERIDMKLGECWSDFYDTPALWRTGKLSWASDAWQHIAQGLKVEPHALFLRSFSWLAQLHPPAIGSSREQIANWRVKRDLVLYAVIQFSTRSLLTFLSNDVDEWELLSVFHRMNVCALRTPDVNYDLRLYAAVVAHHIWERLIRGRWGGSQKLQAYLESAERTPDENWWLGSRIRGWPQPLRAAAHDLWSFSGHEIDRSSWEECESCIRDVTNTKLAGVPVSLPSGWHCLKREE